MDFFLMYARIDSQFFSRIHQMTIGGVGVTKQPCHLIKKRT